MLNQPNARFWLLLKHSLQLHSGWVKTLLLPLIKDNDMIMTLISFVWECKKCYVLGNTGSWTRWQIPLKPLGDVLPISRFLFIAWHDSVCLGTKNKWSPGYFINRSRAFPPDMLSCHSGCVSHCPPTQSLSSSGCKKGHSFPLYWSIEIKGISIAKYIHTCSSEHLAAVWEGWGRSNDSGARAHM